MIHSLYGISQGLPLLSLQGYGAQVYVSRLQQRNQDLIIYRQQQSKQGLMFSSMTNDCATAQAVQHSENK